MHCLAKKSCHFIRLNLLGCIEQRKHLMEFTWNWIKKPSTPYQNVKRCCQTAVWLKKVGKGALRFGKMEKGHVG